MVARWLKISDKSSGIKMRLTSMKSFGICERTSNTDYRLTPLGKRILTSAGDQKVLMEAFLRVPLYEKIYHRYAGRDMPSDDSLDRLIRSSGIDSKIRRNQAIGVFKKSAIYAGLWDGPSSVPILEETVVEPQYDSVAEELRKGLDYLSLFPPRTRTQWSREDRIAWLTAAAQCFDLIYGHEGAIEIKALEEIDTKSP